MTSEPTADIVLSAILLAAALTWSVNFPNSTPPDWEEERYELTLGDQCGAGTASGPLNLGSWRFEARNATEACHRKQKLVSMPSSFATLNTRERYAE